MSLLRLSLPLSHAFINPASLVRRLATTPLEKVLYTARTRTTGGRESGYVESDDKRLILHLSVPGLAGEGTNPEQLFAAGYSACFIGALKAVAGYQTPRISLPATTTVYAEVDLGPTSLGFGISVALTVSIPGLEPGVAATLVARAHEVCPYSNATRGNIPVTITLAKETL